MFFYQPNMGLASVLMIILELMAYARAIKPENLYSLEEGGEGQHKTITFQFLNGELGTYDLTNLAISKSKLIRDGMEQFDLSSNDPFPMPIHKLSFDMMEGIAGSNDETPVCLKNVTLRTIFDVYIAVVDIYLEHKDEIIERLNKVWWKQIFPIYKSREYVSMEDKEEEEKIKEELGNALPNCFVRYNVGMAVDGDTITASKEYNPNFINEISKDLKVKRVRIDPNVLKLSSTDEQERERKTSYMRQALQTISNVGFDISSFELDLSGCDVSTILLKYLGTVKGLRRLKLNGCTIQGVEDEKHEPTEHEEFLTLEECGISWIYVNEVVLSMLIKCKNLRKLEMRNCFVDPDLSFGFIKDLTKLEELDIRGSVLSCDQMGIIFSCKDPNLVNA